MKNEKSTFSVLFYLKKDKMKKNGLVPIHARITIDGKQTQFNTKLEVLETNWKSGAPRRRISGLITDLPTSKVMP